MHPARGEAAGGGVAGGYSHSLGRQVWERRRAEERANPGAEPVATHCCFCAMGCAMVAEVDRDAGRLRGFRPRLDHPVNRGRLCMLGHSAGELVEHPERLCLPLVRHGRVLVPAGWGEALDAVAAGFRAIQERHGREAVAVYAGGGLTNEVCYLLGKFARLALGTPHVDYNGRYCMSAAATAQNRAFGLDRGLNFPLDDLLLADCLLLAGTNAAETLPVLMHYLVKARQGGARFVVVDPRATWTARLAEVHLQVRPGTDLALANALLRLLAAEGWVDRDFVSARTAGFGEALAAAEPYTPEEAARLCGVRADLVRRAARLLGESRRLIVLTGRGAEQHTKGVDTVLAYINVALARGAFSRPGAGFGVLTGQANGQGGREHGLKADQLPGYRSIADPEARRLVAEAWGVAEAALPGAGLPAYDILRACGEGRVRGLLVLGSNPAVSAPDADRVRAWLARLDLLVVVDPFFSETAALAHVVLPGSVWAEEEGSVTNLEGRVLWRRAAARPPHGVTDRRLIWELARRLGSGHHFSHRSAGEVLAELAAVSRGGRADYGGITPAKIALQGGVFWPCPEPEHPGTPRPLHDRFPTPDGRARFHPVGHRPPAEAAGRGMALYVTTGRVVFHYLSGNLTRRLALARKCPHPFVQVHPRLLRRLGLADGEEVQVRTRRGAMRCTVRADAGIRPDTVFVPFHWGGAEAANNFTNPAADPACGMPEFKVAAGRLEPLPADAGGRHRKERATCTSRTS